MSDVFSVTAEIPASSEAEDRAWLRVSHLSAWRGPSHVVQDVSLALTDRRVVIVGRNGMGKSTFCDAVSGLLDAETGTRRAGEVVLDGAAMHGLPTHQVAARGLGYVPQGRRVFRSLTAEENLRVAQRRHANWTQERIYELFPRLAERRSIPAGVLSGGEQQMLAIGRALVTGPKLLLMDEPSEGLAPAIVEQLVEVCIALQAEGVRCLVIEQNLHVACALADDIVVMNNGRFVATIPAHEFASDAELQHRHLGVAGTEE